MKKQKKHQPAQFLFRIATAIDDYSKKKLKDKPNKYTTNENGNDRKGELTYWYQNLQLPILPEQMSNLPALPDLPSNLPTLPDPSEPTSELFKKQTRTMAMTDMGN